MNSEKVVGHVDKVQETSGANGVLGDIKSFVSNLWWLFLVSGIVSILFGVTTLFMPGMTLAILITLFTAYLMAHGLIALVYGFSTIGKDRAWIASVLFGVVLVGISTYLAVHPVVNAIMFAAMIGVVLIARGINTILFGTLLPNNKTLWVISGILSIMAGIVTWIYPGAGSIAFAWVLGLYALIEGTLIVSGALAMRWSYQDLVKRVEAFKVHHKTV